MTTKHAAAVVLLLTIAGTPMMALACVGTCVPDAIALSGAVGGPKLVSVHDVAPAVSHGAASPLILRL